MKFQTIFIVGILVIGLTSCTTTNNQEDSLQEDYVIEDDMDSKEENIPENQPEDLSFDEGYRLSRDEGDMITQKSIDACSGKQSGDSCSLESPRGNITRSCEYNGDILSCMPDLDNMERPGLEERSPRE